jgi:hypothetical protein
MAVHICAYATGIVRVGEVQLTLAEHEDCQPDAISIRAYICDAVLNDALCDNLPDFHVLVANTHQNLFGELYKSTNGISYPLILIFFVLWYHLRFQRL